MSAERRCRATREDGEPCGTPPGFVDRDTGYCDAHDPGAEERMRERDRRGAQAGIRAVSEWARAHEGELTPRVVCGLEAVYRMRVMSEFTGDVEGSLHSISKVHATIGRSFEGEAKDERGEWVNFGRLWPASPRFP